MKTPDLPLCLPTPAAWVMAVKSDFPRFLRDHAACERKAAALAMSFITKYADRQGVVEPMVCLAREELEHFHQVYRLMQRRGVEFTGQDEKDPYVNSILGQLRHGRDERFLDRLVMSGIVEARGYERFGLLAEALEEPDLRQFYRELADREAGHYKIFERLAYLNFPAELVDEAIARIARLESAAMRAAPLQATVH